MLTTGFPSGWIENMFNNETNNETKNCVFQYSPLPHILGLHASSRLCLLLTLFLSLSPFSLDYLVLKVQCGFSETLSFSSAMFLCSEVVLIPHLKLSALYLVMSPWADFLFCFLKFSLFLHQWNFSTFLQSPTSEYDFYPTTLQFVS